MNRPLFKRVLPSVVAWVGLVALCGAYAPTQYALAQDAAASAQANQDQAPAAGQRTDGQIEMDVVHALDASKALKSDLITAATIQGEVTLTGTVSSAASSELAESIAGHVAGVTKVDNNLKVGNPQDAAAGDPNAQQNTDNQDYAQAPPPPPPPAPADGSAQAPDQGQQQAADQGQPPYPVQQQAPPPPPAYPYPPSRPQYAPRVQAYQAPTGPVTIPQGTLLQLRTSEAVGSKRAKDGEPVQFTVIQDVAFGGVLAIPRGATVHGVVSEVKKVGSGDLAGSSSLALTLTSLDLGGQNYPIETDAFKVKGPNKAGQTVGNGLGGAIVGAIIGGALGRGEGAAIGAGAGAAAGVGASAASSGPNVWIPAEALVSFHLKTPLTVTPVNAQEAARLAQGLYPGGPNLYRRGYYPYGSPYYGGYPYYGYPPVYYRPYYMVGGAYYWR
jgi:hypothetical protein